MKQAKHKQSGNRDRNYYTFSQNIVNCSSKTAKLGPSFYPSFVNAAFCLFVSLRNERSPNAHQHSAKLCETVGGNRAYKLPMKISRFLPEKYEGHNVVRIVCSFLSLNESAP